MMRKKILAAILAVAMLVTLFVPSVSAAEIEKNDRLSGDIERALKNVEKSAALANYGPNDNVTLIVVLEEKSLIDLAPGNIADFIKSTSGYAALKELKAKHAEMKSEVKAEIAASTSGSIDLYAIANAFSIKTTYKNLDTVKALDGVKYAYVSGTYDVPVTDDGNNDTNMYSSGGMIGTPEAYNLGYTGKGTTVAVLDTGLDVNHEAFQTAPAAPKLAKDDIIALEAKLVSGSTAEASYISEKIPYVYDYADNDANVYPNSSDHGMHVSGTVAGYLESDDGEVLFSGVAPDAQIISMKVFPDADSGAPDTVTLKALEDAVILDVDAINMSLGLAAGFSEDADEAMADVYDSVEKAGITLCVSAGNDFQQGYNTTPYNLPYAELPDYGLVGSPSTYNASLSVASINNNYYKATYFTSGESKIAYTDNNGNFATDLAGEQSYVPIAGFGYPADYEGIEIEGKLALVSRGDITFSEKIVNAAEAGAVGVIIYNNAEGVISMQIDSYAVPAVSITQADGATLIAAYEAGNGVINIAEDAGTFENPTAGQMSDFSSWGTSPDLGFKPQITAPGGNIYSTLPGNKYGDMSGTSMSSPHMAGVAAILREYTNENFANLSKLEANDLIIRLLMSTADIIFDTNETAYSPRKQGAGLVNVANAIKSGVVLSVDGGYPTAALGDDENGEFEFTFTADNYTGKSYAFDLKDIGLIDCPANAGEVVFTNVDYGMLELEEADYSVSYDINGEEVTSIEVKPGDTVDVNVKISASADLIEFIMSKFINGSYLDGFVILDNKDADGVDLSIPFTGFIGDWDALELFDGDVYNNDYYYYGSSVSILFNDVNEDGPYTFELGQNLYTEEYDGSKISYGTNTASNLGSQFGGSIPYLAMDVGLLRNAENIKFTLTDNESGTEVLNYDYYYNGSECKSYYYANGGFITSMTDVQDYFYGVMTTLPEGTYTYAVSATPAGSDDVQTLSYEVTVDNTTPELSQADFYVEGGRLYMELVANDNFAAMGIDAYITNSDFSNVYPLDYEEYVENDDGSVVLTYDFTDAAYMIDALGSDYMLYFEVLDYAVNVSAYAMMYDDIPGGLYYDITANVTSFDSTIETSVEVYMDGAEEPSLVTTIAPDTSAVGAECTQTFKLTNCPIGDYKLVFKKAGFVDYVAEVAITDNDYTFDAKLWMLGDVTGNYLANSTDAFMVLRYTVDLEEFTADQIAAADVSGDGDVDANDAFLIMRKEVGLE